MARVTMLSARERNLRKALHHYNIDVHNDDDPAGYNNEVEILLEERAHFPRWLSIIGSDEYDITFAIPHSSKADALADMGASMGDGYGKTPIALVDLQVGTIHDIVLATGNKTTL